MGAQKTLTLIKPDGVNRLLIGEIVSRFEKRGLKIIGIKMMQLTEEILKEHYGHLADKPFFPGILSYMQSTPVVAMCLEGVNAIEEARKMCGATKPWEAQVGTIRGDLALTVPANLIHASDSLESAEVEINRFFDDEQVFTYNRGLDQYFEMR